MESYLRDRILGGEILENKAFYEEKMSTAAGIAVVGGFALGNADQLGGGPVVAGGHQYGAVAEYRPEDYAEGRGYGESSVG